MNMSEYFFAGIESKAHHQLGAFPSKRGVTFKVWAPRAQQVSVVGDFNFWDVETHPMTNVDGIWECMVPTAKVGDCYKFAVTGSNGNTIQKSDPFARQVEHPPQTASIVSDWKAPKKPLKSIQSSAMTIYELHLGSWKSIDGSRPTFRSIAKPLVQYLKKLNITHVEFMPITHHPFYGSWGYQCLGYFSTLADYGSLKDLRWLINQLHRSGIGCILDWVPAHFPMDECGLVNFDGEPLFEYPDPKKGFHPDWDTAIFDYGRPEIRSFLLSSARFWLEEIGFDGLRVDAVSSMLYLNYSRNEGEWIPNKYGGHEHLEALEFLKTLHEMVKGLDQPYMLIAEESTSWSKVSFPPHEGGVGFDYKWDMGWMHDTLKYMERETVHRTYHYDELTFRGIYAFHEHFILALSHDEVVHGKGSLIRKMPGDEWQKFANCRLLFAMMMAQPGKKMIFMGMEFGQDAEWNHDGFLQWETLENPLSDGLQRCYGALNGFYRREIALHDDTPTGFIGSGHRDEQQSVLMLIRQHEGECIVGVFNCTESPIQDYAIGVPFQGEWFECFNTDDIEYGGSGLVAQFSTNTVDDGMHGFGQSIRIGLPPLGGSFWKWRGA